MKFLPHRDFDEVTSTLNFDTADCHVIGGCDLYTTKAAGSDKKLYKNIENGLEAQHDALLRFSNSLSPPQASMAAASLNLSRSSPFGPLSEISSRRTYAYLIATLNASHPDYDFSHLLRPSDFKRESNLRAVMNSVDTTLYNLRPRPSAASFALPGLTPASACPPSAHHAWGPQMWRLIDSQMSLKECSIYRYAPEEDIFEGEDEGAVWSLNYFFFNKQRKRVCYLYLRGISILSHSPPPRTPLRKKRFFVDDDSEGWRTPDSLGAKKRARYWLGDRDGVELITHPIEDDDDDHSGGFSASAEADKVIVTIEESDEESEGSPIFPRSSKKKQPLVDEHDNYILSDDEERSRGTRSRSKSTVRGVSEEIAAIMEV